MVDLDLSNGSFETETYVGWMSRNSVITRGFGGAADGSAYAHVAWARYGQTYGMRELSSTGAVLASAQTCLVPGSTWSRFATIQLTTVGGGELDLDVYQTRKPRNGDWFDLDGVSVTMS